MSGALVLDVRDLVVEYAGRAGLIGRGQRIRAVDGVTIHVERGETHALVGESGSGKTSVARAIVGIVPATSGTIRIAGNELSKPLKARTKQQKRLVQVVFQQPTASLDPRITVGASIGEPLQYLSGLRGHALASRVAELLDVVGLPLSFARRYPSQLSGGQRQRVAIARALGPDPAIVICDEPTSSLDVSVQAQIVNLLVELQGRNGISLLFITHDLGLVRQVADDVTVMQRGVAVESGPTGQVLDAPKHDYTVQLLSSVPDLAAYTGA